MKEAMKLALEALVRASSYYDTYDEITAVKQALAAQPTTEESLATQPAQRTWVGLTNEEAFQICVDCGCLSEDWLTLLDAIEAKLRSKNT